MITLTIRTDSPEAEVGLFSGGRQIDYLIWHADRQLSKTIHQQIDNLLKSQTILLKDLSAIVCYKGPGSFTGLRIGLSVANALSYGLSIPIVGTGGKNWIKRGISKLSHGVNEIQITPKYGALPHITPPRR